MASNNNAFEEYDVPRPNSIVNSGYILQITERNLQCFLYKIKGPHHNVIILDKYVIKIICLTILYGYSRYNIYNVSNIKKDLQILLFTLNDFGEPKKNTPNTHLMYFGDLVYVSESVQTAIDNLITYLHKLVNTDNTDNTANIDSSCYKNNTNEKPITFAYNFIDNSNSSTIEKRIKKVNNKKLSNEEMFKPSLLFRYFLQRMPIFYILAGEDNINFGLMRELILNSFLDDCMFDHRNLEGFTRYVSKHNQPTSNKIRVPKLRFNNETKTYNSGPILKRKPKTLNTTNNNNTESIYNYFKLDEETIVNILLQFKYAKTNTINLNKYALKILCILILFGLPNIKYNLKALLEKVLFNNIYDSTILFEYLVSILQKHTEEEFTIRIVEYNFEVKEGKSIFYTNAVLKQNNRSKSRLYAYYITNYDKFSALEKKKQNYLKGLIGEISSGDLEISDTIWDYFLENTRITNSNTNTQAGGSHKKKTKKHTKRNTKKN
jgi:hypothetical protein